jgi:cathepsin B
MQTKSILLLLASAVSSISATKWVEPAINKFLVENINMKQNLWVAHESPRFDGLSKEDAKHLCGTFVDPELELPRKTHSYSELQLDVPDSFDSREQWPDCKMIGYARDQANCGSCWAFASTEAFNDRLCIASKGKFTKFLSTMATTECCSFLQCFSMGCNGGQPGMAWRYFKTTGIVTGGNYDDIGKGDSCYPYKFESCAHHIDDPSRPACDKTPSGKAAQCPTTCSEKGYQVSYSKDIYRADSSYSLSGEDAIKRDILQYGPVSAAFTVYEDFPAYKSGVYHHVSGEALGGHAVKIIGWGEENGTPYWLIMNSWNEMWGDKGTFKIKRGVDECGIESMGVNGGHVSYKTSPLRGSDY